MMNVVIDAGRVMVCPDEAFEAAKKPRKVFDFLPELNTCGRKARRALEILFKK